MAITAIEQQAFFIKKLKSIVHKDKNDILLDYDQSETEDLVLTSNKTVIANPCHNAISRNKLCSFDLSETDTLILR